MWETPRPVAASAARPDGVAGRAFGHIALALGSVFLILAAGVVYAVQDLEEETGEANGVELEHARGTGTDPVPGPGTARYEDGVKVTVTAPRPASTAPADGAGHRDTRTVAFSVTYTNHSDEPLSFALSSPMDAWAGTAEDEEDDAASAAVEQVRPEAAARRIPDDLAPGDSVTVPLRYRVAADEDALTFRYGASELREDAYWELPLPD